MCATINQKRVAKEIVDTAKSGKKFNSKKTLENIGYSKNTARGNAKEVIESKGVKEELEKAGFSVGEIDKVVNTILHKGKEPNRLKAANMGYKRLGSYKAEEYKDVTDNETSEERLAEIKKLYRKLGIGGHEQTKEITKAGRISESK